MTELKSFWSIVTDVWRAGFMGYSIGDIMVALIIFLVFYGLRGIFRNYILKLIDRWISKRHQHIDANLAKALTGPLQLAFITFGLFFSFQYVGFQGKFEAFADQLIRSMIATSIFWVLHTLVTPLSALLSHLESFLTREMVQWLITGLKWGVIFLGVATILQIWGIQVGPILAGLGLFGVAVALGAQDLFRNLIGGLCILIEKRFQKGDWIRLDGVLEGTVENIGFRSTMVRRFDAAPVYVPNQKLSDAAVTNFSKMTYRRIYWKIGLQYSSSVEQLRTIRDQIEAYLRASDAFVQPPEASLFVRIDAFNDSSIDLMLYTFTRTRIWGEWLEHKESLAFKIKEIVEQAGSGFAFPSQSIYLESRPLEGAAEIFQPPENASTKAAVVSPPSPKSLPTEPL